MKVRSTVHSTDILYTDYFAPRDHPQPESYTFHHNGDFSGDVYLELEGYHVEEVHAAGSEFSRHGQSIVRVTVPFDVLAELVAKAVRDSKISKLEQATDRDILDL